MDKNSLTPQQIKLEELRKVLPEVFTENKVDWEKLKAALGEDINFENERYVLNWAGKGEAFEVLQTPSTQTLTPTKEESVNFDTTKNIFIEGENLEVLKILQKSYFGQIKMIYIDPPYNTGSDSFIYPDKFSETKAEYAKRVGDTDEEGYLTKSGTFIGAFRKNAKENGQYHSNWLNMMMPRLYLAKNLLKDDGVIFISIDDNEKSNLKLVLNEIFGEENFVASIVWQKIHSTKNDAKYFSNSHEYLFCYSKNLSALHIKLLPRTASMNARFSNPDDDPRGVWASGDLVANEERVNGNYEITGPTGKIFSVPSNKHWVYSKQNLLEMIKDGRIWFGKNGDAFPRLKRYLTDVQQGKKVDTLWFSSDVGHNQESKRELKKLFDEQDYFDFPKPVRLIKQCLQIATNKRDLILDFFSGSATTAHAVMQLNAEDGGRRQCISVQLPELCDENSEAYRAGYKTIADISKERIRRAGLKIIEENKDKNGIEQLDIGFKVLKLTESNFKQWRTPQNFGNLQEQVELFVDPVQAAAKVENIVYELLLKLGKDINSEIENKNGFYIVNDNECVFILETVSQELVDDVLKVRPQKVIALDKLFIGNDQLKTNTMLQMKDAGIIFQSI